MTITMVSIDYKTKYSSGHIEMTYDLFKRKYSKIRKIFKDCEYLNVKEIEVKI